MKKQEDTRKFVREYISPATVDATFAGVFDISKGYKVYAKPNFPTAATYFDEREKKHIIFIGTDMSQYTNANTVKSIKDLVRSLLIHELGHTLFTHVDNKSLNEKLQRTGIPFPLFNLAEDARIEHLIKKEIQKESGLNHHFGWEEWFVNPEINVNAKPESVLFLLINTEGRDMGKSLVSSRVAEYYERFLNAKDSYAVIDILNEWKNEFHNNPAMTKEEALRQRVQELMEEIKEAAQQSISGSGSPSENQGNEEKEGEDVDFAEDSPSGSPVAGEDGNPIQNESNPQLRNFGDIGELTDENGNPTSLSSFLENAVSMEDLDAGVEMDNAFRVDASFNTVSVDDASISGDIFVDDREPKSFYPHEVDKIEKALKKLQKKEKESYATRKPTNRFNTNRMFAIKSDPAGSKIYRRSRERISKKTEKNIMFILDLSGSMSGTPIRSARTLMVGANRAAKQFKNLNITILGSKIDSGFCYQTIKLPANENALLSVSADGGAEGIGYALENASSEVSKNDVVVFLTDGQIHDKEIKKSSIGKFLKKGAISLGIYVDDAKNSIHNRKMKEWFDELIVKDNMPEIIERIIEIANDPNYKKMLKKSTDDNIEADESFSPKI